MAGFISEVARALARSIAVDLRNTQGERTLTRGECVAIATILQIAGASGEPEIATSGDDWASLESAAKADFDLVRQATSAHSAAGRR